MSSAGIDRGKTTALLVIDMINDYDHDDGEALKRSAASAVPVIADLVSRARSQGTLVIYVNDNHGLWQADRRQLVEQMSENGTRELIDPLLVADDAPFVFKARHSIFFGSSLAYLLDVEQIGRLVLTGQVTEQCILYSALDAYIRHFHVVVPRQAVAHIDEYLARAALRMMERNMRAEIVDAETMQI